MGRGIRKKDKQIIFLVQPKKLWVQTKINEWKNGLINKVFSQSSEQVRKQQIFVIFWCFMLFYTE